MNRSTLSMRGLNMKKLFCLGLIAGLFLMSSPAFAEDPIDKDLEYFWGQKRDVEVIQKRLFLRDGRHEFTVFGGVIPNDDFFANYPIGARYNWYFLEDWSVELNGSYMFNAKSDLRSFLQDTMNLNISLDEQLKGYAAAEGQWTPFHGKFSLLTQNLTHFDINISFGAGVMFASDKLEGETSYKLEYLPMGNLGAGMRFYVLDWMAVRLDYRHYFYKSNVYNGLSWPAEVTLGVAFFTKGAK